jgi:hypothetical protein
MNKLPPSNAGGLKWIGYVPVRGLIYPGKSDKCQNESAFGGKADISDPLSNVR